MNSARDIRQARIQNMRRVYANKIGYDIVPNLARLAAARRNQQNINRTQSRPPRICFFFDPTQRAQKITVNRNQSDAFASTQNRIRNHLRSQINVGLPLAKRRYRDFRVSRDIVGLNPISLFVFEFKRRTPPYVPRFHLAQANDQRRPAGRIVPAATREYKRRARRSLRL